MKWGDCLILLSLHDETQNIICAKIAYTEYMLTKVLKKINGISYSAEITVLEDLGFANNIMRMQGGFFTGINVKWDTDVPFVPVDTTVNSCGVSVFKFDGIFDFDEFKRRMTHLDKQLKDIGIINNFNRGNHFISICVDSNGSHYLVLHASDNKYKYGEEGLYPRSDSWYYDRIKTETFPKGYIRYIKGDVAEKFYHLYLESEKSNPLRNKTVAEIVLKDCSNVEEILYSPHYGMPNNSSVSIGSQWQKSPSVLLTYEGAPIFIVTDSNPRVDFMPHGFGLTLKGNCHSVGFINQCLTINDIEFNGKEGLMEYGVTKTRNSGDTITSDIINKFMPSRSIKVINELKQMYSYTRNGVRNFMN